MEIDFPPALSPTEEHSCIELFTGAGGMMLGLEAAGWHTIVANEMMPSACDTLRHNFPRVPILPGSIREMTGRTLLDAAGWGDKPVGMIAGGPPCQGFSVSGHKNPDDPRNTLIGDFLRIVNEIRPRFFVMENVLGLVVLHEGRLFHQVQRQIADIGYQFHYQALFAADYGVPQMRRRIIVIGSRDGAPPPFPLPSHARVTRQHRLFSDLRHLHPYVTCGEAIGDLPLVDNGESSTEYACAPQNEYQRVLRIGSDGLHNHVARTHGASVVSYYRHLPPGGTPSDIPAEVRNRKKGLQRLPMNGLSRTITTVASDFVHPTLHRNPTARELARIQGFPDRHRFFGSAESEATQVGNAVPPQMAEAIGRSIYPYA